MRDLARLARRCGIRRRLIDGLGQPSRASIESVMACLRAMGVCVELPEDARGELARLDREDASAICEPVAVRWHGEQTGVRINRKALTESAIACALTDEAHRTQEWGGSSDDLCESGELPVPYELPPGFYRLDITCGSAQGTCTLVVAPQTCHPAGEQSRDLGVFLPLYALRSDRNLGIGSLGELALLKSWASGCGASLTGTLPILSTFLDERYEPSPYAPVSRSVFGEFFIDMHDAVSRYPLGRLQRLLANDRFCSDAAAARNGPLVDYRASWALVRKCLEAAAADVAENDSMHADVDAFADRDPLITQYAEFRQSIARNQTDGIQERDIFVVAQWLVDAQLASLSSGEGGIYLDLPVGAHGAGFDAYRRPELFAHGVSLGAPADALFRGGQSWGFPPQIPRVSRAMGHADFIESVDRHMRHADALRVDHVAGLYRCYWVPDGFQATDGLYVHHPFEEYAAILSLLSLRHRCAVIGEDLGTIPVQVCDGMSAHGMAGMRIGQFEMGHGDDPIPSAQGRALVALNTHDTPTFAGFWAGDDIELNVSLGILDASRAPGERDHREWVKGCVLEALTERGLIAGEAPTTQQVCDALNLSLSGQDASHLIVSLEDLWGEPLPQNVPGVVDGYPSWRRRALRSLDEITNDEQLAALLRSLADARMG